MITIATRRAYLVGGRRSRYSSKSFASGVKQSEVYSFYIGGAQATYTFSGDVIGGNSTQWSFNSNPASSMGPGDGFNWQGDGSNFFYVYYTIDGSGSGSGYQVDLLSTDDAATVASKTYAVISSTPGMSYNGDQTLSYYGATNENQNIPSTGSAGTVISSTIGAPDPGYIGTLYFFYRNSGTPTGMYAWYSYSNGSDPGAPAGTSNAVQVSLSGNYTSESLASRIADAISSSTLNTYITANPSSSTLTLTSIESGSAAPGGIASGPGTHFQSTLGQRVTDFPNPSSIKITNADGQTYLVWIDIDSGRADPGGADFTAAASCNNSDNGSSVSNALTTALNSFGVGFNLNNGDGSLRLEFPQVGAPLAATVVTDPPFTKEISAIGTSAIDLAANTLTVANHGYITGVKVRLTGNLPAPLLAATDYWVIKVTANTLKLAASLLDANANTAIDLTSLLGVSGSITITPQ